MEGRWKQMIAHMISSLKAGVLAVAITVKEDCMSLKGVIISLLKMEKPKPRTIKKCKHSFAYASGCQFLQADGSIYQHAIVHCPDCGHMRSVKISKDKPQTYLNLKDYI